MIRIQNVIFIPENTPESVDILESLELDECWLIEYRDDVVAQLKNREKTA